MTVLIFICARIEVIWKLINFSFHFAPLKELSELYCNKLSHTRLVKRWNNIKVTQEMSIIVQLFLEISETGHDNFLLVKDICWHNRANQRACWLYTHLTYIWRYWLGRTWCCLFQTRLWLSSQNPIQAMTKYAKHIHRNECKVVTAQYNHKIIGHNSI